MIPPARSFLPPIGEISEGRSSCQDEREQVLGVFNEET
jgi:hypothetical protein